MKKVFISSVMRDFKLQRAAARTAVDSLRLKPVMAEDFGAKPFSSKVACTEGVRQSDIYVGILGPRYGFITEAGISVTEEEFNEARHRGLPIFWFVQNCEREADQQKFYERIGDYKEGNFVVFFETAQELQAKITASLFDHIGQPDVATLDVAAAARHVENHLKTKRQSNDYTSYLSAIIFPSRQGETYLSLFDMGRDEFKDEILQRAMFGSGAIFQKAVGTDVVDKAEHLLLTQGGTQQRITRSIEVFGDGTLHYDAALGAGTRGFMAGGLGHFIVDQDEVRDRLTAFLNFANAFYASLESSPLLSSFYLSAQLRNLNSKSFGRCPAATSNTMSIPMSQTGDPVLIPSEPMKVARVELSDCRTLAEKFVALAERLFKSQGRYFHPRN